MTLILESPAFENNATIPTRYTCEGDDVSPPLTWKQVPDGTQSLVLIIDDPDAPDPSAPRMTWVHWLVYNIPAETTGLTENMTAANLPEGTKEGLNDWKQIGYGGPSGKFAAVIFSVNPVVSAGMLYTNQ